MRQNHRSNDSYQNPQRRQQHDQERQGTGHVDDQRGFHGPQDGRRAGNLNAQRSRDDHGYDASQQGYGQDQGWQGNRGGHEGDMGYQGRGYEGDMGYGGRSGNWQGRDFDEGNAGHGNQDYRTGPGYGGEGGYRGRQMDQDDRQSFGGRNQGYQNENRNYGGGQGYQGRQGNYGGQGYQNENRNYGGGQGYQSESRNYGGQGYQSDNRNYGGGQGYQNENQSFGGSAYQGRSGSWDLQIGPMGVHGQNQGMPNQGMTMKGRAPKGYKRSDERIQDDICDRLMQQGHIDASDIEVKVTNGEVTLTGNVENRSMKHTIENMIDAISGVEEIHNQLRVKRQGQGQSMSDTSSSMRDTTGGMRETTGTTGTTGTTASTNGKNGQETTKRDTIAETKSDMRGHAARNGS